MQAIGLLMARPLSVGLLVGSLLFGGLLVGGGGCDSRLDSKLETLNRKPPERPVASPNPDWPQWLGPHRDGSLSGPQHWPTRPQQLVPQWEVPLGLGYSSPVVSNGKAVVQDRQGDWERVICVDLETGKRLWETRNPTAFETQFPMYTTGPIPTPCVAAGYVVTIGAEGWVQCLDLETGERIWGHRSNDLMSADPDFDQTLALPPFGAGASPIVLADKVVVALPVEGKRHSLYQLDLKSGEVLWHSLNQRCSYATPVIDFHSMAATLLVLHDRGLAEVDWQSGTVQREYPFRSLVVDSENAVSPVVLDQTVFLSAYGMPGTLLDGSGESWTEIWSDPRTLDSQYTNVVAMGNRLAGFSARTKRLHVLDSQTGKLLSKTKLSITRGMLIWQDQQLLILGDTGQLVVVDVSDPEDVRELFCTPPLLTPKTFAVPGVAGDRLLIRDEFKLLCLRLVP